MKKTFAVLVGALILLCICGIAKAEDASAKLNDEGISLFRSKQYEQSVSKFEEAVNAAPANTEEQLAAARNVLLPLESLANQDQLWQAKRRVALIEHELYHTAIPAELDAPTRAEAMAKTESQRKTDDHTAAPAVQTTAPTHETRASMQSATRHSTETTSTPPEYLAATKLMSAGDANGAIAVLDKVVKTHPTFVNGHIALGNCYQRLKKYDAALQQYDWVAAHATKIGDRALGGRAGRELRDAMAGICPGKCLKMSMPGWSHYPGLNPNLLWMKFEYAGGWRAWSTHHLGEVIEYVNGHPESMGKCPICHGTGKVAPLR